MFIIIAENKDIERNPLKHESTGFFFKYILKLSIYKG